MLEGIQYLAVEGVIGSGKTSLAEILASMFAAGRMLEHYEDNPFLGEFYRNRKKFAFQTQIWFLLSRYRQIMDELSQKNLFHKIVVSDFMYSKDKIFAYLNLDENELALYNKIAAALDKDVIKPDFVIYLQASTDTLMERIAQRGRAFEKGIEQEYIESLNKAYNHFFFHYQDSPLLIVNTDHIDFTQNVEELDEIVAQIERFRQKGGTRYYQPLDKNELKEMAKRLSARK